MPVLSGYPDTHLPHSACGQASWRLIIPYLGSLKEPGVDTLDTVSPIVHSEDSFVKRSLFIMALSLEVVLAGVSHPRVFCRPRPPHQMLSSPLLKSWFKSSVKEEMQPLMDNVRRVNPYIIRGSLLRGYFDKRQYL